MTWQAWVTAAYIVLSIAMILAGVVICIRDMRGDDAAAKRGAAGAGVILTALACIGAFALGVVVHA